jgi:vancomycin resistance protein YoaR
MQANNDVKRFSVNKKLIIFFVISFISILTIIFISKKSYAKISHVVEKDAIYSNIYINNINVGNLNRIDALDKINSKLQDSVDKKIITFVGNKNDEYKFSFKDFNATYNTSDAVEKAYNYARTGNLINRYKTIIKLKDKPIKINAIYSFDKDFVKSKLSELESFVYIEPTNASIKRENNKFIITPGSCGQKLNLEKTLPNVLNLLEKQSEGQVELFFDEIQPKYDESIFSSVKNVLGSFTTVFTTGEKNINRNANIINAANKINNSVVYPGEIFSVNEVLKPYTTTNGYRNAPVIFNGKIEDALGGGICQVSTTLYNAILLSELDIVERQNHSLKVGYIDYAYDATLAGDYIDLKFKNSSDTPILIESYVLGNKLFVNIYGKEIRNTSRKIRFENNLVEIVTPPTENIIYTNELSKGQKKIETKAKNGYKYELYKIISENNCDKEKILINKSYYRPTQGVVKIGTKDIISSRVNVADENINNDSKPSEAVESKVTETNDNLDDKKIETDLNTSNDNSDNSEEEIKTESENNVVESE